MSPNFNSGLAGSKVCVLPASSSALLNLWRGEGGWQGNFWRTRERSANSARPDSSTPEMNLSRRGTVCLSKRGTVWQLPRGCAWKVLARPPQLKIVSPVTWPQNSTIREVCPRALMEDFLEAGFKCRHFPQKRYTYALP